MQASRFALLALTACRLNFDDATHDGGSADGRGDGTSGDGSVGIDCHVNHAAALFCDGFEDGRAPWGYQVLTSASIDATTTRAWGGTHALEVHTNDVPTTKDARWGNFFTAPFTTGDFYLRQYLWLPSSVTIDGQVSLLVTQNDVPPYPSTFYMLDSTNLIISSDGSFYTFPDTLPRDRWVCAEMQIHVDPTAGFVRLTLDNGTAIQTPLIDTEVAGGYAAFDAGVHYANGSQSPVSVWMDDVVVDTAPIGCN